MLTSQDHLCSHLGYLCHICSVNLNLKPKETFGYNFSGNTFFSLHKAQDEVYKFLCQMVTFVGSHLYVCLVLPIRSMRT